MPQDVSSTVIIKHTSYCISRLVLTHLWQPKKNSICDMLCWPAELLGVTVLLIWTLPFEIIAMSPQHV